MVKKLLDLRCCYLCPSANIEIYYQSLCWTQGFWIRSIKVKKCQVPIPYRKKHFVNSQIALIFNDFWFYSVLLINKVLVLDCTLWTVLLWLIDKKKSNLYTLNSDLYIMYTKFPGRNHDINSSRKQLKVLKHLLFIQSILMTSSEFVLGGGHLIHDYDIWPRCSI